MHSLGSHENQSAHPANCRCDLPQRAARRERGRGLRSSGNHGRKSTDRAGTTRRHGAVGFSVRVRAANADGSTDTAADFINAEFYTDDVPANLPPRSYLQGGERQFDNLVLLASGSPIRLRVRDADDSSVPFGEILIDCYDYVESFTLVVPPGDKFVDQVVNVTLQARDIGGGLVLNFRDDIVLDAAIGDFASGTTTTVPGTAFSLGEATVPIVFWGTDPVTRENTLSAINTRVYPGQGSAATGSAIVSPLRPGPLGTVVLLLPGESLTPGVSPGKTGTPLPQISGNSFNGIDVYATDSHWNPVEPTAYPQLSWSSDDPSAGVILPPGGAMASNAELDETVRLIQSGLRRVTVTASGSLNASSESNVVVNPEGLDHFVFDYTAWIPSTFRSPPFHSRFEFERKTSTTIHFPSMDK